MLMRYHKLQSSNIFLEGTAYLILSMQRKKIVWMKIQIYYCFRAERCKTKLSENVLKYPSSGEDILCNLSDLKYVSLTISTKLPDR